MTLTITLDEILNVVTALGNMLGSINQHQLDRIERKLDSVITTQKEHTMTLAQLAAKVTDVEDVEKGAITLLALIAQMLKDAIAAGADPAAIQAIADTLETGKVALAKAIVDNTPAAAQP